MEIFSRSRLMLGDKNMDILSRSAVAVFGLGGVGSYAAEILARSGIGRIVLIDSDKIEDSNINRQLPALHSTIGRYKTHVVKQRIEDINPHARVTTHETFVLPGEDGLIAPELIPEGCSYIIDAGDTVSAKIAVAVTAQKKNIPLISAMGCGNKIDPSLLTVTDIYSTSVCPLCRVMRRELKKRGVSALKVVYSSEQPVRISVSAGEILPGEAAPGGKKHVPASVPWVPSAAGILLAAEVIRDILKV